jgi:hypothetical protein
MSAAKHTPGPWSWGRTTVNTGTGAHEGDLQLVTDHRPIHCNDPVVFTVREDWTRHLLTHPEGQANARLIAAAPEMRELLQAIADADPDQVDIPGDWQTDARVLLARIDGTTTDDQCDATLSGMRCTLPKGHGRYHKHNAAGWEE